MASLRMRSRAFVLTGSPPSAPRERSLPSRRSRSTNGGGAQARRARRRTRQHRRRRACHSTRGRRRSPRLPDRRTRWSGCTTGTTWPSTRPASTTRRRAWARRTPSASSSGPADRAARWRSSTSRSSRSSTRSIAATRATWACRRSDRPRRWTPPSRRPRTTRSSRCFPSQKAQCDQLLADDLGDDAGRHRQDANGIVLGRARRRRHPRCRRATTARSTPSRCSASTTSRATGRATGGRIRSASCRSRSARTGATVRPFVAARRAAQFRAPPPPALDSAAYAAAFNEVKRLGGDGVTTPTERTDGPDDRRHLLGLRRHAEPVRAAAALQPDRDARSPTQMGIGRGRAGAAARAGQRGDGRRRHRDLGVEVLLQVLAAGHRHPRGRRRAPGRPGVGDGNPATVGDPDFQPARRAGQQPARARTSRRRSRPIRRATPASAARCSRSCAVLRHATTSRSRSSPTSSTA